MITLTQFILDIHTRYPKEPVIQDIFTLKEDVVFESAGSIHWGTRSINVDTDTIASDDSNSVTYKRGSRVHVSTMPTRTIIRLMSTSNAESKQFIGKQYALIHDEKYGMSLQKRKEEAMLSFFNAEAVVQEKEQDNEEDNKEDKKQ